MIGPQNVPTAWTNRLANLVHELRPDWDETGIASILRRVSDRPLGTVVLAAVVAADQPTNRTPAVIAADGPHWRVGAVKQPDQPPSAKRCCHDVVGHCNACNGSLPTPERIREIRAYWRDHPESLSSPADVTEDDEDLDLF